MEWQPAARETEPVCRRRRTILPLATTAMPEAASSKAFLPVSDLRGWPTSDERCFLPGHDGCQAFRLARRGLVMTSGDAGCLRLSSECPLAATRRLRRTNGMAIRVTEGCPVPGVKRRGDGGGSCRGARIQPKPADPWRFHPAQGVAPTPTPVGREWTTRISRPEGWHCHGCMRTDSD